MALLQFFNCSQSHLRRLICYLRPYFRLNFSIRPAVSRRFCFPVKNGWDLFDISILHNGYSLPSSHLMVSLVSTVDRVKKAWSHDVSLNTTIKLAKLLKSHNNPLVCESGINSPTDIKFIFEKSKILNFLIGESLLKSKDIGSKLRGFTQINP